MKTRKILLGASLLVAAVLGTVSCQKPSGEGSGVRFRARTSSSPLTKTAYSGEVSGGKERINWLANDELTIACAECGVPSTADYRVTGSITTQDAISVTDALTPVSGNGLEWGTGVHQFYSVYPAGTASVTTEGVASASLPASQGGTETATSSAESAGVTTVSMAPDMGNGFMYASQTASPGNDVELTFKPMFTAFQFTVGGDGTGGDVTLSKVELSSASCALSGNFSLNIGSATYTIPAAVTTGESANNKITYTFPADTKINTDKQIRFTLFVQPSSNVTGNANLDGTPGVISDLTIRFTLGDGVTTRALKLKYDAGTHGGNFVDFPGGHKINVTGLTLPTQLKSWSFTVFDVNAWETDTPDVLYGSPVVVEPGEGWIAESFGPDVSGMEDKGYFYNISPLGSFSVSATKKVSFSPGNLQAVFDAAGDSFTWQFAEHQWSYVGDAAANTSINGNGSVSAAGTVDLFGWSTNATRYGIHNSDDSNDTYSGDFKEWGNDSGLVDALGFGWRTLTVDEWTYLLETRDGDRYCKATVNSVSGLVIFPDDYSRPSGVTDPVSVNTSDAAYTSNSWSGTDWTKMEAAGCVFLPAAGFRSGTLVIDGGSYGFYWSSSPDDTDSAYYMSFYSSDVYPAYSYDRFWGHSVRLVQDLVPPTISFSVSSSGAKVKFSKGNLQAVFAAAGSTFTWKFADRQWDYVGNKAANTSINGNGSVSAAGTVDLFGWSTAATTYGIHNSTDDSVSSGDFVDWGSDSDLIAALGFGWRTLTNDEWIYLLFTRTTRDGNRYCKATVNGVSGLVIFPDDYSHPAGVTVPDRVNTSNADYTSNTWSGTAWTAMEAAGCVFLPAAGGRNDTSVGYVGVGTDDFHGNYWSSKPYETNDALYWGFSSTLVLYDITNVRCNGRSVRLVQDL